ncbi:NADPH-dependent FMN reductase [Marinoscillum sp.]|uniref:NADPH-dependent FMN reductase n=1 Tax=Marinoscillum sp. TaxID=2024838 RepID=UPI003BAAAF11
MKVAIIITDTQAVRHSPLVALELDERLTGLGLDASILDLADSSYQIDELAGYDYYLLVGGHTGPLYNQDTHKLLTDYRTLWRNRKIGTVMVSDERILAESANEQLRTVLKSLSADLLPESLLVMDPEKKFDESLNLIDSSLNLAMYRFLFLLVYGEGAKKTDSRMSA